MVVYKCKRIPDEGECIQLPQCFCEDNIFTINQDLRRFLPRITEITLEHEYHGWNFLDVSYLNEFDLKRKVHINEGSFIIKRSDTDWSVYPEQTFKKMYSLEGTANEGPLDNVITW